MKSRAYNAGRHVHNFFAMIGSGVATGAIAVKDTVVEFGHGVKEGGPSDRKEKTAKAKSGGTATA